MKNNYHFEPINKELTSEQVNELEKKISKSISFIEKNLTRLSNYLKNEEEAGNYIEINLPKLDSELSFKINLYYGKIIISIICSRTKTGEQIQEEPKDVLFNPLKTGPDYEIVGHLMIDGLDCLAKDDIKRLGSLLNSKGKDSRFKDFSDD